MGVGAYLGVTFGTILVLVLGIVIGYLFGTKKVEEIKERIQSDQIPTGSGSIKPLTGKEKSFEDLHGEEQRKFEHIINP